LMRPDYYEQLTAEVKVPHKSVRGRLVWQCKSGRRNEALDCEVYAMHAARSLKVNLWRAERWEAEESAIKQPALFGDTVAPVRLPGSVKANDSETSSADAAADDQEEGGESLQPDSPKAAVQTTALATKKQPNPAPPKRGGWSAKNW